MIGAGPAGLSAAVFLQEAGVRDVVVFEARAVPGGKSLAA
ncbi:MAG: NAD(P)-binding protein [Alphaproteobacteria bacterium]